MTTLQKFLLGVIPPFEVGFELIALIVALVILALTVVAVVRSKRDLVEQVERWRTTLASIGDAVITTDTEARITNMNAVAESLTGWTNGEAVGVPLTRVFRIVNETTRAVVENPAIRALREGVIVGLANHTILIAKDGTERPIDDSAAPIRCKVDQIVGCVLVFRDVTDRRRHEQVLFESEAFSRGIFENSPDCVKVLDADGRLMQMNVNGMCVMEIDDFGPFKGRLWCDLWPTEGRDEVSKVLESARTVGVGRFQGPCPTARGTPRWWDVLVAPIRDGVGNVIRYVSVSRDITEQKHAEEALRESEARIRAFADAAPAILWVTDPSGSCTFLSREWYAFTGQTADEALGLGWTTATHPDYQAEATRVFLDANDRREEFRMEYLLRVRSGGYRWALDVGRPRFGTAGEFLGMIGVVIDTHDRKEAEQQFRTLAENITQLAWMARPDGHIYWYNRRWYEYTGTNPETQEGWGWESVHDPAILPSVVERWTMSLTTGEPFDMVFPLRGGDGIFRPFLTRITPVKDAEGRIVHWFGTNTDITEQLETAEKLRIVAAELSEADRRKDEFLATLAHELRNPLAPIRNGLQIMRLANLRQPLETPTAESEMVEEARTMMERQLSQMVRLVDDLLDVSRISRGKLELRRERVELSAVITSAVETSRPVIESNDHELAVRLPSQPIFVDADVIRLAQVFSNLLNNAAKYSERGGRIELTAERQDGEAVVTIRDTGVGIPPDMLRKIFDMFTQVDRSLEKSQGGLGIGLTLVKRLTEMHGGSVEARSDGHGRGSEFIVRLPIVANVEHAIESPTDPVGLPGRHRILVADDNEDSVNSLAMLLTIMGNEVRTANDGSRAIEVAEEFRPDVILLDIGMPKLNGYEVCRRIREQSWAEKVLLVALTGWGQDADKRRAQEAGFDEHMVKPVALAGIEKLLASVPKARG